MTIKQCDRKGCNNVYKHYGNGDSPNIEPNGAMIVYKSTATGTFKAYKSYDLCPECLEKLKEFLGGEDSETDSN